MNQNLSKIIQTYATKNHKELSNQLLDLSKDNLIACFNDLLTMYINDKNSSTIREYLTVLIAGYEHNTEKLGFNGFRANQYGKPINCEVKPQNIQSQNTNKKLNAGGNFTDFTYARFEKHKQNNLNMLFSGFIDGKLIYILELPYNDNLFLQQLEKQLQKRFPKGDLTGQYLRSASFSFTHFKKANNLKIIYSTENLQAYQNFVVKNLYNFLKGKDND